MASKKISIQLAVKSAAWFSANPTKVLLKGQKVYKDDQSGLYKLGDGTSQLSALNFLGGGYTFSGNTSQYTRGDGTYATFPTDNTAFSNGAGYITSSALSPYLTSATAAATYQPIGSYQPLATNLTSVSNLSYVSTSFVKMTAAGTFALDTNTYLTSSAIGVTVQGYSANTTLLGNSTTGSGSTLVLSTSPTISTLLTLSGDQTISGKLSLGTTSFSSGVTLWNNKNITGALNYSSNYSDGIVQSDVTTSAVYYDSVGTTQAASFTLGAMYHFKANQGTIGAGSSVTTQAGFYATSSLIGATYNYGFWGAIASGTNRWNLYMSGTAENYLAGSLGIGTNSTSAKAHVISTTEQLRLAYDASNYTSFTVDSTGINTIVSTGFNFGNAAKTGMRLARFGQGTGWIDIGSASDGTGNGYISFNQTTNTLANGALFGGQFSTVVNSNTNVLLRIGNATRINITDSAQTFSPNTVATGAVTNFTFTKPNNTNQTASTAINGFLFTSGSRQWNTGAITTQKEFEVTSPTYSFVGASTITDAYTAYFNAPTAGTNATITNNWSLGTSGNILSAGSLVSSSPTGGVGYFTGAGGTVTQATSRTTGVTLNKTCGAITLVSAAGSATFQTFTVTNSSVAATDTIVVNQKSGTDLYEIHVTAVAAGSFNLSFRTTGGTTVEQPVFNFSVIKAVTA